MHLLVEFSSSLQVLDDAKDALSKQFYQEENHLDMQE